MKLFNILFENYLNSHNNKNMKMRIGIFAGAFKPCHKGHFAIAKQAAANNDSVYIIISPAERDGITAKQSERIWKIYSKYIPNLIIQISKDNPIRTVYELVSSIDSSANAGNTIVNLYCDKEDMGRYDRINNYSSNILMLRKLTTKRLYSATQLRANLKAKNKQKVFNGLPVELSTKDKEQIWKILSTSIPKITTAVH